MMPGAMIPKEFIAPLFAGPLSTKWAHVSTGFAQKPVLRHIRKQAVPKLIAQIVRQSHSQGTYNGIAYNSSSGCFY